MYYTVRRMKIPNDGTSHDIIFLNLQFKNFLPQITQISTDLPDGSQVEICCTNLAGVQYNISERLLFSIFFKINSV